MTLKRELATQKYRNIQVVEASGARARGQMFGQQAEVFAGVFDYAHEYGKQKAVREGEQRGQVTPFERATIEATAEYGDRQITVRDERGAVMPSNVPKDMPWTYREQAYQNAMFTRYAQEAKLSAAKMIGQLSANPEINNDPEAFSAMADQVRAEIVKNVDPSVAGHVYTAVTEQIMGEQHRVINTRRERDLADARETYQGDLKRIVRDLNMTTGDGISIEAIDPQSGQGVPGTVNASYARQFKELGDVIQLGLGAGYFRDEAHAQEYLRGVQMGLVYEQTVLSVKEGTGRQGELNAEQVRKAVLEGEATAVVPVYQNGEIFSQRTRLKDLMGTDERKAMADNAGAHFKSWNSYYEARKRIDKEVDLELANIKLIEVQDRVNRGEDVGEEEMEQIRQSVSDPGDRRRVASMLYTMQNIAEQERRQVQIDMLQNREALMMGQTITENWPNVDIADKAVYGSLEEYKRVAYGMDPSVRLRMMQNTVSRMDGFLRGQATRSKSMAALETYDAAAKGPGGTSLAWQPSFGAQMDAIALTMSGEDGQKIFPVKTIPGTNTTVIDYDSMEPAEIGEMLLHPVFESKPPMSLMMWMNDSLGGIRDNPEQTAKAMGAYRILSANPSIGKQLSAKHMLGKRNERLFSRLDATSLLYGDVTKHGNTVEDIMTALSGQESDDVNFFTHASPQQKGEFADYLARSLDVPVEKIPQRFLNAAMLSVGNQYTIFPGDPHSMKAAAEYAATQATHHRLWGKTGVMMTNAYGGVMDFMAPEPYYRIDTTSMQVLTTKAIQKGSRTRTRFSMDEEALAKRDIVDMNQLHLGKNLFFVLDSEATQLDGEPRYRMMLRSMSEDGESFGLNYAPLLDNSPIDLGKELINDYLEKEAQKIEQKKQEQVDALLLRKQGVVPETYEQLLRD